MTEPRRRPGAEESALEIHVEHQIPVALAHLEQRHARIHAGVVDEHVDAAELADDLRDHRLRARGLRDVALDERGAPASATNLLGNLLGGAAIVEVVHADVGALARERQGDGTADSLLGAGHERHFPGEPHRRPPDRQRASAGGAQPRDGRQRALPNFVDPRRMC